MRCCGGGGRVREGAGSLAGVEELRGACVESVRARGRWHELGLRELLQPGARARGELHVPADRWRPHGRLLLRLQRPEVLLR